MLVSHGNEGCVRNEIFVVNHSVTVHLQTLNFLHSNRDDTNIRKSQGKADQTIQQVCKLFIASAWLAKVVENDTETILLFRISC